MGFALLLILAALLVPASAVAAPAKHTHRVPVSQPDEYGGAVALDVDVYLPDGPAPPPGHPLVVVFHGGGSDKDNGFDATHARMYAEHGYASVIYTARGHGGSGGQTTVAGPKEVRDLFDVLGWAIPRFGLDRNTIALAGYSQGGLHTNLVHVWAHDRTLNPEGLKFVALEPGNTPDVVFNALVTDDVVKLSFGLGLIGTYYQGTGGDGVSPRVNSWIATAAVDRPELYGGALCDLTGHDRTPSTMRSDLAARSVGCQAERMTLPTYWMQAFDDALFPAEMAVDMWRRMPDARNRLYLSMGGHGAPGAPQAIEDEKIALQIAYLDHVVRGAPFGEPAVVYWTRDTGVAAPIEAGRWKPGSWYRQTATTWPPPGVTATPLQLGADGRATAAGAADGDIALSAPQEDAGNDPVATTLLGPSPSPPPSETQEGRVAVFEGDPLGADTELSGAVSAKLSWTPASPDTQLVVKVLAEAPSGALTLLTRGVTGMRGQVPGERRDVEIATNTVSAKLPKGHRPVVWVSAGDATFYKAYPGSAGGVLHAGAGSTVSLPLRTAAAARSSRPGICTDRVAPTSRVLRLTRRGVSGTARDRGCGVGRVWVSVGRRVEGGCRYVGRKGLRSCHRPVWLRAGGRERWRRPLRLSPGRYVVRSRAVDVRGNVQRRIAISRLRIR